jgi:cytochrome c-type biogenesis protein CcmF
MMGYTNVAALILTFAATASLVSFVLHGLKLIKATGLKAITTHRRVFGAVIVHIGLAMMAFGVIYSALYSDNSEFVVSPGESVQFGEYTVNVGEVEHADGDNWHSDFASLDVNVGDKYLTSLYPEMRLYNNKQDNYFAEVAYHSMAKGDLYSILQGYDTGQNIIRISLIFQPLIIWIWIGCVLMCIGAVYGATQSTTPKEN